MEMTVEYSKAYTIEFTADFMPDLTPGLTDDYGSAARRDSDGDGMEQTAGDLFDALYERLALARTRALMGEAEAAGALYGCVAREYAQYQDVFAGLPGHVSLEHDLEATRQMLCLDSLPSERGDALPDQAAAPETAPKQHTRRRASKAA